MSFVDVPGYGFAKVPDRVRQQWRPMIENYLMNRPNLVGVLHLVDVRHKPTSDDELMADWLRQMEIPFVVVATKADKISRGKYDRHLKVIRDTLHHEPVLFSAQTGQGRDKILELIRQFLE